MSIFKQIKLQSTGYHTQFVSGKIECQFIDFPITGDQNIAIKEQEKFDKEVWNVQLVTIPVVIGALGENR